MGSSPEPAVPAYRRLRVPRKHPQVLGVDLNRSEPARTPLVHLGAGVGDNLVDSSPVAMTVPYKEFGGLSGCARAPGYGYRQKSLNR